ncbi:hypothetical protein AHAS_Ahas18G0161000 [Arachis hypogaea]
MKFFTGKNPNVSRRILSLKTHVLASTPASKVQKRILPQIQARYSLADFARYSRYPLVEFAFSSTPPPSDTTTGDHHRLPSLSSFFSFFPIYPFFRSCVRHPCSWSHPLSAFSSTDKQPPTAATFCATATSPPPHRLSVLLPPFINAGSLSLFPVFLFFIFTAFLFCF